MNEQWVQVDGFPNYEVSSYGRVRRVGSKRCLKTPPKSNGYLQVTVSNTHMQRNYSVHRLVAKAFLPPANGKELVLHRDGNRANNHSDNLYWGDLYDNAQDAIRHGTFVRGSKNGRAKLTEDDVRVIRRALSEGSRQVDIARRFGVSRSLINKIALRKFWRHVE